LAAAVPVEIVTFAPAVSLAVTTLEKVQPWFNTKFKVCFWSVNATIYLPVIV
jgi:hypothetical protein